MARCAVTLLFATLTLLLTLEPGRAAADAGHPLEPLDTSSPRATLRNFLNTMDELGIFIVNTYRNTPSRANWQQMVQMVLKASGALDLSEVPPAARQETGFDRTVMLYDVLAKIELPLEEAIPDAAAYS